MSTNPFDDVVETEKNYERNKRASDKVEKADSKPQKKDSISISFNIDKKWLERGIFLFIILVELYFILANPICSSFNFNFFPNMTKKADKNQSSTSTVQTGIKDETLNKEAFPKQEQPKQEAPKQEPEEEQQAGDATFEGNFDFSISDIQYEENDAGDPSKMSSIEISMNNRWKTFKPLVKIFWYDSKSVESMGATIRTEKVLPTINKGTSQKVRISEFKSKFFYPEEPSETIKVQLYNSEDNQLLETSTKQVG